MATFIQIHALTSYPASNLNRDDSGRPKTMVYGHAERLRVSSQSLKRAFRTSPAFHEGLHDALGTRAQSFGRLLEDILINQHGLAPADAVKQVAKVVQHDKLGALKNKTLAPKSASKKDEPKKGRKSAKQSGDESGSDDKEGTSGTAAGASNEDQDNFRSDTEQLAFLGPDEIARLEALAERVATGGDFTEKDALVLLQRPRAADIAMFGRMLADNPGYNVEAACQVAHAFTTHRASVEDDYFTAVDELKAARREADKGAGFVGVQEFGAGTFYLYVCLCADELIRNLSGDRDLSAKAARALIEAIATASPGGKQNSFASRGRAHWMLVEVGSQQPRTLGTAFEKPIRPRETNSVVRASIDRLQELRKGFARVYGRDCDHEDFFDVDSDHDGVETGNSLASLKALADDAVRRVSLD